MTLLILSWTLLMCASFGMGWSGRSCGAATTSARGRWAALIYSGIKTVFAS
jgi:hypothetical protein